MKDLPLNSIIHRDAALEMADYPDKSIDVIITDPPWPNVAVELPDCQDFQQRWPLFLNQMARLTDRLIIVIGCDTDPRFLKDVPTELPFVRVCRLGLIPPRYKGPILFDAEYAYVFGHNRLPGNGQRVLPGECFSASQGFHDPKSGDHPCPRRWAHMLWLVKNFSRPEEIVLDPFCGTGTIPAAAAHAGRRFIGIELYSAWHRIAVDRVASLDGSIQSSFLKE